MGVENNINDNNNSNLLGSFEIKQCSTFDSTLSKESSDNFDSLFNSPPALSTSNTFLGKTIHQHQSFDCSSTEQSSTIDTTVITGGNDNSDVIDVKNCDNSFETTPKHLPSLNSICTENILMEKQIENVVVIDDDDDKDEIDSTRLISETEQFSAINSIIDFEDTNKEDEDRDHHQQQRQQLQSLLASSSVPFNFLSQSECSEDQRYEEKCYSSDISNDYDNNNHNHNKSHSDNNSNNNNGIAFNTNDLHTSTVLMDISQSSKLLISTPVSDRLSANDGKIFPTNLRVDYNNHSFVSNQQTNTRTNCGFELNETKSNDRIVNDASDILMIPSSNDAIHKSPVTSSQIISSVDKYVPNNLSDFNQDNNVLTEMGRQTNALLSIANKSPMKSQFDNFIFDPVNLNNSLNSRSLIMMNEMPANCTSSTSPSTSSLLHLQSSSINVNNNTIMNYNDRSQSSKISNVHFNVLPKSESDACEVYRYNSDQIISTKPLSQTSPCCSNSFNASFSKSSNPTWYCGRSSSNQCFENYTLDYDRIPIPSSSSASFSFSTNPPIYSNPLPQHSNWNAYRDYRSKNHCSIGCQQATFATTMQQQSNHPYHRSPMRTPMSSSILMSNDFRPPLISNHSQLRNCLSRHPHIYNSSQLSHYQMHTSANYFVPNHYQSYPTYQQSYMYNNQTMNQMNPPWFIREQSNYPVFQSSSSNSVSRPSKISNLKCYPQCPLNQEYVRRHSCCPASSMFSQHNSHHINFTTGISPSKRIRQLNSVNQSLNLQPVPNSYPSNLSSFADESMLYPQQHQSFDSLASMREKYQSELDPTVNMIPFSAQKNHDDFKKVYLEAKSPIFVRDKLRTTSQEKVSHYDFFVIIFRFNQITLNIIRWSLLK